MTFTADQLKLKAHIEAKNAEGQAQMDAKEGLWISQTTSDPSYWAGLDIYTVEQFEFTMAWEGIYDCLSEWFSKSYARSVLKGAKTTADLAAIEKEYFQVSDDFMAITEQEYFEGVS